MFFTRTRPNAGAPAGSALDLQTQLAEARERLADLRVELSMAVHDADRYRAENERLREENERLRAGLPPVDWPPPLTAQERRELNMLREQVRALHERLHQLTMASVDRDAATAGVAR